MVRDQATGQPGARWSLQGTCEGGVLGGTRYSHARQQLYFQSGPDWTLLPRYKRKWKKLAGSLPTETEEGRARAEDAKWQPIRCYMKEAPNGIALGSRELRLSARMFWRDRYLYPMDLRDVEVGGTFVVMLESLDRTAPVYQEFSTEMAAIVERAVVEPTIEVESEEESG